MNLCLMMLYLPIIMLIWMILLTPSVTLMWNNVKVSTHSCLLVHNGIERNHEIEKYENYIYDEKVQSIKSNVGRSIKKMSPFSLIFSCLIYASIKPVKALDSTGITVEIPVSDSIDITDAVSFSSKVENTRALNSDEFIIPFNNSELGIAITETSYNGFPVCTVSKILETNLVVSYKELRIGAIITKINDTKVDGIPLREIAKIIKLSPRPVYIKFRDPSRYVGKLKINYIFSCNLHYQV